ncbi:MAG TPA: FKBP-type peptidyl-prolyl cis-trans isomerase [Solirubrobacterales bacterium]|jgi:peptidylprolyl isomerase|nr:FKBP-type peptidyl-prolyl cis-trans isomerase [Solirubrobacterales bacterium]
MDRRVVGLLVSAGLLAIIVAVVVVARGGDDGGSDEELTKPVVEVPQGPPPNRLEIEDIEVGGGAEAQTGDRLSVQYVGVLYDTGQEFDSSWDSGQPLQLQLGAGSVIPGWDQGLEGMREGGRRQLVIPPDLAYGAAGQPPDIPPNATLVFVVDLVSVS